ncbi:MlaA family lipoprotein [Kineobactrum salinum]|uniref:VacJ family lipoprotein n=1 Tax=Kineobactrum salinum TaxID=2708301 RepID=A0A6C0U404_9GAMM|nr:VacJ family lipoprotein [Kineobactrum salinum]QIB64164.1 VacJ family lipoprotein [Kineobactrum salinum]
MTHWRSLLLLFGVLATAPAYAQEDSGTDPFEAINRPIFEFNDRLDRYVLKPTAKGYQFVMPDVAEQGVTNVFANLRDANAAVNALLQGRPGGLARAGGRFLLNSTIGMLGLFDVATPMGVERYRTDFGHTLAIWGLPQGPYLVVPVLGSRTVRSGTGSVFDSFTSVEVNVDDAATRNTLLALDIVNTRARLLRSEDLISGDRYIFIRDAYLQRRRALVSDGEVDDSFSDFGEDDWDEDF